MGAKWRGTQTEAARAGSGGRKGWSTNYQGGCGAFQSLTAHRSHASTRLRHALGPTIMSTMLKINPPQKIAASWGRVGVGGLRTPNAAKQNWAERSGAAIPILHRAMIGRPTSGEFGCDQATRGCDVMPAPPKHPAPINGHDLFGDSVLSPEIIHGLPAGGTFP